MPRTRSAPQRKPQPPQRKAPELPDDPEFQKLFLLQVTHLIDSQRNQRKPHTSSSSNSHSISRSNPSSNHTTSTDILPQQALLDIISDAFAVTLADPSFGERLRTIKDLFLSRDFAAIFTNHELLPVYAAEYLPGRALCYRDIFMRIDELRSTLAAGGHVLCLGAGCGSELLGIASTIHAMPSHPTLTVHIQDLSSYGSVIPALESELRSRFALPNESLAIETSVSDLTDTNAVESSLVPLIARSKLITAMFVLNEILSTSKRGFTALISKLLQHMQKDAYLLVVDSAGSFSEVAVGSSSSSSSSSQPVSNGSQQQSSETDSPASAAQQSTGRVYMSFDLLDAIQALRIVSSYDAIWYRFPPQVSFPLKLNNMRYFLRVYQKK
eukprot:jgi/Hompol1/3199/HPOL_003160-RA